MCVLTEGQPPANLGTKLEYTYTGVPCQDTSYQATQQVRQVLDATQCVQEGTCQASVAHSCAGTGNRKRRSTDTMTIMIALFSEPLFDGSGFNLEQIALDDTTGSLLKTPVVYISNTMAVYSAGIRTKSSRLTHIPFG